MKNLLARAGGLLAVVLLLAAPSAARAAAGTNIGDASQITGSRSGTLPTALADDWYVVYPSATTDQITVKVTNTSETGAGVTCSLIVARFTDSSGLALNSQDVTAGDSYTFSGTGQDRYFVDISDDNCNPGTGPAAKYTALASGSFGPSLKGAFANAPTGGSIGDARTGLDGHVAYQGSISSGNVQQWLVLESSSTSPLAIRVEGTTPLNTANCSLLIAGLTDTFGQEINAQDIAQNTAYTFTVDKPGRYFLRLQDDNCDPPAGSPVTYDVQLDPTSAIGSPPAYPLLPIQGGVSQSAAAGPVAGGIDYTDTIPDATTTKWYAIRVDDTAYLTVENTSPFRSPCGLAVVRLYDSSGTNGVGGEDLADDTGFTFDLSAGTFYLAVSDNGCDPDTGSPLSVQLNVTPAGAAVPGPAFGGPPPPACQDATASTTQSQPVTFQLGCSGGTAPLTYQVLQQPASGQITVDPQTGMATYTPRSGFAGADSFTFNVIDATRVQSAGATATITVGLSTGVQKNQPGTGGGTPTGKGPPKKTPGKTPNYKALVKVLNREIPGLQKEIAELDRLKNFYHLFVTGYEKLSDLVLKHPALKQTPGVNLILKIARDATDLFLLDNRDYVDQVDAHAHEVLAAFTALRNAINHPKDKNLAKLYHNATTAGRGGATQATKLKQIYRGFSRAINLLTGELAKDPSIKNNPLLTGAVKVLQNYMKDALKQLENAEQQQSRTAAGEAQVAGGG